MTQPKIITTTTIGANCGFGFQNIKALAVLGMGEVNLAASPHCAYSCPHGCNPSTTQWHSACCCHAHAAQ